MRVNPAIANQMYLNYSSSTDEDSTCLATGTYSNLAASKYVKDNDKNKDGVLSKDEVTLSAEAYAKLDANSDGKVSKDEMKEALAGQDKAIYQYYKNGGAKTGKDLGAALLGTSNSSSTSSGTFAKLAAKSYLKDKDKNQDGVLSSDEVSLDSKIFAKLDANSDGKITSAELLTTLSKQESAISKYYAKGGSSKLSEVATRILKTI